MLEHVFYSWIYWARALTKERWLGLWIWDKWEEKRDRTFPIRSKWTNWILELGFWFHFLCLGNTWPAQIVAGKFPQFQHTVVFAGHCCEPNWYWKFALTATAEFSSQHVFAQNAAINNDLSTQTFSLTCMGNCMEEENNYGNWNLFSMLTDPNMSSKWNKESWFQAKEKLQSIPSMLWLWKDRRTWWLIVLIEFDWWNERRNKFRIDFTMWNELCNLRWIFVI